MRRSVGQQKANFVVNKAKNEKSRSLSSHFKTHRNPTKCVVEIGESPPLLHLRHPFMITKKYRSRCLFNINS